MINFAMKMATYLDPKDSLVIEKNKINHQKEILERDFLEKLPLEIWSEILKYTCPIPALIADLRDMPSMRQVINVLQPIELKKIGLPDDMNVPLSRETINLIRPLALNQDGSLTPFAQEVIAQSPYATVRELNILSNSPIERVRTAVATNNNTPIKTLTRLAEDEDWYVRLAVAECQNTPADTLKQLAEKHQHWYVRLSVAQNQNTPADALTLLAEDSNESVRSAVACHQNTPRDTLILLTKDKDWEVRLEMAKCQNTPADIRILLAEDSDEDVRHESQNIRVEPLTLPAASEEEIISTVAENQNMPAEGQSKDAKLLMAQNQTARIDTLIQLAEDPEEDVRSEVASNKKMQYAMRSIPIALHANLDSRIFGCEVM